MILLRAAVAVAALLLGLPAPAAAEPGRLELSRDGRVWHAELTRPLFREAPVLVPGGRAVATLHVRNASPSPAMLTVQAGAARPAPGLARHLDVTATIVGGRTRVMRPAERQGCSTEPPGPVLGPGETQLVRIGVGLADVGGRVAQGLSTELSLLVRLVQVPPGRAPVVCGVEAESRVPLVGGPTSGPSEGGGGPVTGTAARAAALPDAGSSVRPGVLWLGVLLVLLGAGTLRLRNRTGP
jgi:hypothetical protein